MIKLQTSLREYGHPDIVALVDPEAVQLADWLPDYFTEEVRGGTLFESGQIIQIGWNLLKLEPTAEGSLSVFEPDFDGMPIRWVEGVNRTVRFLVAQRAVCDELRVQPDFPSIRQALSLPASIASLDRFSMTRIEPDGNHSGWVIHDRRDAAMRNLSLYEAATWSPAIVAFLALPPGSVVERNDETLSVATRDNRLSSLSNGLLARLALGTSL
jgi:hypothetical protein